MIVAVTEFTILVLVFSYPYSYLSKDRQSTIPQYSKLSASHSTLIKLTPTMQEAAGWRVRNLSANGPGLSLVCDL